MQIFVFKINLSLIIQVWIRPVIWILELVLNWTVKEEFSFLLLIYLKGPKILLLCHSAFVNRLI